MTAIDENLIGDKENLFRQLAAISALTWNVKRVKVRALREQLLIAQKYKCVYCRRPIVLDEVGHRDLDHILPKSQNPQRDFDLALAQRNEYENRRHTTGYASCMYMPMNLCLSCKICNATKGSFDPFLDRSAIFTSLPVGAKSYCWVHPYYDVYAEHIDLIEGFIYRAITPEQGQYVISACGLDTLNGLSARILDAMMLNSEDLSDAMLKVALSQQDQLDLVLASQRIYAYFQVLTVSAIETYLRRLKVANTFNSKIQVLEEVRTALGTGDFIAAVA